MGSRADELRSEGHVGKLGFDGRGLDHELRLTGRRNKEDLQAARARVSGPEHRPAATPSRRHSRSPPPNWASAGASSYARQAYRSADSNGDQAGRDDSAPRRCRLPDGPLFHIADVLRRSRCATDRHSPDVAAVGDMQGRAGRGAKKGALDSAARTAQLRSPRATTRFPRAAGICACVQPVLTLALLFREIAPLFGSENRSTTPPDTVRMWPVLAGWAGPLRNLSRTDFARHQN